MHVRLNPNTPTCFISLWNSCSNRKFCVSLFTFGPRSGYPYWPATVVPCNQKKNKHKDQFRIGTDPKTSKFWVQFFNENSGAFVNLERTNTFNPLDWKKYMVAKSSPHYEGQLKAFNLATEDFYILNPEMERPPELAVESEPAEGEAEDDGNSAVSSGSAAMSGKKPARRKRSGREDDQEESGSRQKSKRARVVKEEPEDEDVEMDGSSGDDAPLVDAEILTEINVAKKRDFDESGSDSAIDESENRAGSGKAKKRSVKVKLERKQVISSAAKPAKTTVSAEGKAKIASLERSVKSLRAELRTKDAALEEKAARVAELERKVRKLKARSNERVTISLPNIPPDLPADLPPKSQRATQKVDQDALQALVTKCSQTFGAYETVVSAAMQADAALSAEAKKAVDMVQPRFDNLKETTEAVLECELKVAEMLRTLYRADVSAADITQCKAGKVVKRIARRATANSTLLSGLASAVSTCWIDRVMEASAAVAGVKVATDGGVGAREPGKPSAYETEDVAVTVADDGAIKADDEAREVDEDTKEADDDAREVDDAMIEAGDAANESNDAAKMGDDAPKVGDDAVEQMEGDAPLEEDDGTLPKAGDVAVKQADDVAVQEVDRAAVNITSEDEVEGATAEVAASQRGAPDTTVELPSNDAASSSEPDQKADAVRTLQNGVDA
jgi:hypothetical protein